MTAIPVRDPLLVSHADQPAPAAEPSAEQAWRPWPADDVLFERLRQRVRECLSLGDAARAWAALRELGAGEFAVPLEAGGLGLGHGVAAMVAEEVGASMLPVPIVDALVAPFIAGEVAAIGGADRVAVVAMPGRLPSPLGPPATFLACDQDGAATTLSGTVGPLVAGVRPDRLLITTQHDACHRLWAVAATAPGVTLRPLSERDGDPVVEVAIDGLRIDDRRLLLDGSTDAARLDVAGLVAAVHQAALLCGLAAAAMTALTERLLNRRQFDRPLAHHQSPRLRTAALLAQLDVARLAVAEAAVALDSGALSTTSASGVVGIAADTALAATREAVHLHGAAGLAVASTVARAYRRVAWEALRCGPLPALWRAAAWPDRRIDAANGHVTGR